MVKIVRLAAESDNETGVMVRFEDRSVHLSNTYIRDCILYWSDDPLMRKE